MIPRDQLRGHVRRSARCSAVAVGLGAYPSTELALLFAIAESGGPVTAEELADRIERSRHYVRRLLDRLTREGAVTRGDYVEGRCSTTRYDLSTAALEHARAVVALLDPEPRV